MTVENQEQAAPVNPTAEEFAALKGEYDRLQAKVVEANKHTKQAERQAADEAKQKAEAEGNYQQLFKSSEVERQRLLSDLESLHAKTAQEKVDTESLRVASGIAKGSNIELLAEFVKRRLRYADGCVKVTDKNGNLTVSSMDDLKKEFASSTRYASLIAGPESSGGGATGGTKSGSAATITRKEFEDLDPITQSKIGRSGTRVIN